ncbi:MAG: hypothetical protein QW506_03285 [Thermoproteota archaeon]
MMKPCSTSCLKKIYLGRLFLLSDLELISSQVITVENIEKVYGR